MLDHHIQRTIVYTLAFADAMRFSELQPDDVDSKLFTYHLKKVIHEGYAIKNLDGTYSLTSEGRRVGKGALKKQSRFINRAYSILFLVIRRKSDGAWLLYKRGAHPLIGLSGLMHAQPNPIDSIIKTAQEECRRKTGLRGDFTVINNGYFRVYKDDELESFTHFTLLACDDIQGELSQNDELGEYYWQIDPDFTAADVLPTARVLAEAYLHHDQSFIEQTFRI
jgi:hypothetical protein